MDIKKESLGSSIINFEPETIISNPSGINNFHTKCGEIFVSKNNEFLVTCCQCNGSFGKFDIYLDHMKKLHLDNQFEKENSVDLSSNHSQFNNSKERNTMDFYVERDQMEFISNNNQMTASQPPAPPPPYPHHSQHHHQSISSHIPSAGINNPINFVNPSTYKPVIDQSINSSSTSNRKTKLKLTNNSNVTINNHSYKCEYCHKEFTQSQNLTVHKRIHTGEKPYTCEFCDKSFSHKSNLNVHKRTHTGGQKMNNNNNRNMKLDTNQQQQHHQHTGYNSSSSSNSTTQNSTNNYIEVPVNPYFMTTSQMLPIHSNSKIPENFHQNQFMTTPSATAQNNSNSSNNNNNNNNNSVQSDGLYKCEYCHKTFSQSQNLVVHKRIHTGEKPYICEFCDKSFSHKSNLNVHKRTHTGLKPYKCDICEKLFSDKSALIVHKRLHSGEKPFQCRFCERSFAMKNDLKQHENTHTGEKPHQCETCDKSFANNSNLIIHRRIHTGEKPYECDVCYKAFRHNSNLIVHKRTHSNNIKNDCDESTILINNKQIYKNNSNNEKIYHCNLCEKTYMNNSSLYTHKRTHHRENINTSSNSEQPMVSLSNVGLKLSMGLN